MVALLLAGLVVGCSTSGASGSHGHAARETNGTLYWVFLDTSKSVRPGDRGRWTSILREWLLADIGPADGLRIFSVSENTSSAAPLYTGEIDPVRSGAPLLEIRKSHMQQNRLRQEAQSAIETAFANGAGTLTDLVSALDRIQPVADRRHVVVFVSDMKNDTPELSLERVIPSPEDTAAVIDRLFSTHLWNAAGLSGVEIHCILDSRDVDTDDLGYRMRLRQFWDRVFERLGSRISTFENYPPRLLEARSS